MSLRFKIKNSWDKIRWFFRPRQRWLIKKIPKHWIDLDTCVELCVLERFKYFVDEEECFKTVDFEYSEKSKKLGVEIKRIYDMVTVCIPNLEIQLEEAWQHVKYKNPQITYEENYGEIDRLEAEITKLKTEALVWIVSNRGALWT